MINFLYLLHAVVQATWHGFTDPNCWAEREGFEPLRYRQGGTASQDYCLQPLGHLSVRAILTDLGAVVRGSRVGLIWMWRGGRRVLVCRTLANILTNLSQYIKPTITIGISNKGEGEGFEPSRGIAPLSI